jgi:hypothetical protein
MSAGVIRANQYSELARLTKALALADALDAAEIGSRAATGMNGEQWVQVASACRILPPSIETRMKVVEMLRSREVIREKLRGKDPFTVIKGGRQ